MNLVDQLKHEGALTRMREAVSIRWAQVHCTRNEDSDKTRQWLEEIDNLEDAIVKHEQAANLPCQPVEDAAPMGPGLCTLAQAGANMRALSVASAKREYLKARKTIPTLAEAKAADESREGTTPLEAFVFHFEPRQPTQARMFRKLLGKVLDDEQAR